jgi:hypothetical protein
MLHYVLELSHIGSLQWRKVIASFSYRSELIEIVIASYIYRCSLIGIVIASYSYRSRVTKLLSLPTSMPIFLPSGMDMTGHAGLQA